MAKKPRKLAQYVMSVAVEANTYMELAAALDVVADCLRERLAHCNSEVDEVVYWRYLVTANPRLQAVRRRGNRE